MTTAKKTDKELCRLVTPEFRLSYPHLAKAQSPKEGDKPKFSITMLFPKDTELMGHYLHTNPDGSRIEKPRGLKEVIRNAKIVEFGQDKSEWPDDLQSPVIDGDDPKHADKEGYAGHWVIKASTMEENRPSVVDEEGKLIPLEDIQSRVYPGCYARAYVYAFVYFYPNRAKPMKKGITFVLDHVQFIRDGKSFGGKKSADQVFGPVGGGKKKATQEDDSDTDFR